MIFGLYGHKTKLLIINFSIKGYYFMRKPIISSKFYTSDSADKMAVLRSAMQVLNIPKSIDMQYYDKSICFRSINRRKTIKVDVYFDVFRDYPIAGGHIKSVRYNFNTLKDAIEKTIALMKTWIELENCKESSV